MVRTAILLILAAFAAEPQTSARALANAERGEMLAVLKNDEKTTPSESTIPDGELIARIIDYASQELGQRIRPGAIDHFWAIEPERRNVATDFAAARDKGALASWLATLSPELADYGALKTAYRHYAAIVARGGWTALPAGNSPALGQPSPIAAALRARLEAEDYTLPAVVDPAMFDEGLANGLQAFQARHGLAADGKLGPATRTALDISATSRLDGIEANLERLRWLPRPMPEDRLEVDIGAADATLFESNRPILTMRVVVGKPSTRTPMFRSQLEAVVFNPPWNVPDVIAKKEILPKAARTPGYWANEGFVMTAQGVQQRPGPKNALGQIKFDLNSPFGVYLHDTPTKSAFQQPNRALSHGCMRLEKPRELAQLALGWDAAKVDDATASGVTVRDALPRTIPLFVLYRTVVVDSGGAVVFRPDVYGWDAKLSAALAASRPISKPPALLHPALGPGVDRPATVTREGGYWPVYDLRRTPAPAEEARRPIATGQPRWLDEGQGQRTDSLQSCS